MLRETLPRRARHRQLAQRQVRLEGFDEKVLSLYARGITTREPQDHLEDIYEKLTESTAFRLVVCNDANGIVRRCVELMCRMHPSHTRNQDR